jgi:hypothetical protein
MTAYNTEFIKEAPAFSKEPNLLLLENSIDFSVNNLDNGDTVRLFKFDGVHVLKVMWEAEPCNAAATITLGDSADANDWSNDTNIACSTTVDVVGQSAGDTGFGVGKSYAVDADNYLLMTIGAQNLTSGKITVKALCVRM